MSQADEKEKIHQLTKREKDVLLEITKGKSNKEIAASLFISEKVFNCKERGLRAIG